MLTNLRVWNDCDDKKASLGGDILGNNCQNVVGFLPRNEIANNWGSYTEVIEILA